MSNRNEFDDLINAARTAKQDEQQQRQQSVSAAEQAQARALEARRKTLAFASYAAELLVAHSVRSTVRLLKQQPQTLSWRPFGHKTDPATYETIAEGWPIIQGKQISGHAAHSDPVFSSQGIVLTREGTLMQYAGGDGGAREHYPTPTPKGDLVVAQHGLLGSDPHDDAIVIWGYLATHGEGVFGDERSSVYPEIYGFTYERHLKDYSRSRLAIPQAMGAEPTIEGQMQGATAKLIAESIEGQGS